MGRPTGKRDDSVLRSSVARMEIELEFMENIMNQLGSRMLARGPS